MTAAIEQVPKDLRPGVQALSFQAMRWWGRAVAIRKLLARKAPPAAADALLCTALALSWRDDLAPYAVHTLVNQAVEAARRHKDMRAQAPFVNACLRRFLRERDSLLHATEADVTAKIKAYEDADIILGYRAVINEEKLGRDIVRAVIEVKITPERGGGFDRLAERIAKYSEVHSCHLMSGGYDLLVVVEGTNLREVATFVSEKLATVQGVISTATHFMLKPYKEQGVLMKREVNEERLAVSP